VRYDSENTMSSLDEDLRAAMTAHNGGHLATAEMGYSRVLRKEPTEYRALYGMGLLDFHTGAKDKGIDYLLRCVQSAPNYWLGWNTLGSMYAETGRMSEGRLAYLRATEVAPGFSEGWYNLGICSRRVGDLEGAVKQLRTALACPNPHPRAYDALANMLYEQGRLQEAAQVVAEWAVREPQNPVARYMAKASSDADPPQRAPDDYVRAHFDTFATVFDFTLRELKYQAPELVANALRIVAPTSARTPPFQVVLDAGCGTGLCGPLVRGLCSSLVGVDLSPNMLANAKQRGCYDELVAAELSAFMRSRPGAFDAIVSADTLLYFGPLEEPLAAAHAALRSGSPLVFTLEALSASHAADHRLQASGRFSHSESYVRRALQESGFEINSIAAQSLRQERGAGVEGYLVVARRL
jgi:predicted TPR repeat methyltransferase